VRRSRRLRKKLRLGEFQELGFSVDITLRRQLTTDESDAFLDALVLDLIEPRSLAYGGGSNGGFVVHERRGSATEADREAVVAWLRARKEVEEVEAGALVDVWYGADLESDTAHAAGRFG
jgi:hypothetical protein